MHEESRGCAAAVAHPAVNDESPQNRETTQPRNRIDQYATLCSYVNGARRPFWSSG